MELRPITRDNWYACIRMKVRSDQDDFVHNNAFSLVQAAYNPGFVPLALYDGDEMVGFTMFRTQPDGMGRYWIDRVMVAPAHQGKGYGRALMELVIARMRADIPDLGVIALDYREANTVAARLYASLGFRETGERDGPDVVAVLHLG
jgi:diamine N-acetyltransferase